jgi:uncharacterized membrane protein
MILIELTSNMDINNQTSNDTFTPPAPTPPPAGGPPPGSPHQNNTLMAILCYLGILVIIPILTAKDDPFVKFHIKQGLVLLIAFIISGVFVWIPILGWILWLITVALMVTGIVNAASNQQKELPIIGHLGRNFHI